jgi:hypothetical protein
MLTITNKKMAKNFEVLSVKLMWLEFVLMKLNGQKGFTFLI